MIDVCRQRFGFLAATGKNSFANLRKVFFNKAKAANEVYKNLFLEPADADQLTISTSMTRRPALWFALRRWKN